MLMLVLPGLLLAIGAGLAFHWLRAPVAGRPWLSADPVPASLQVGARLRRYLAYLPATLPHNSPLLIVLHGAGQDAQAMRKASGFAFERLADRRGFAVVYPDGHDRHWNDSRAKARHAARELDIDDKAFIAALIDHMFASRAIALDRVFVFGYSNGGQMAFRLARELPGRLAAIAVVGANLPAAAASLSAPGGPPVAAMLVSGTDDPISPYDGGKVTLFGFGDRGEVQSARASADHFARLSGASLAHSARLGPARGRRPDTRGGADLDGRPRNACRLVFGLRRRACDSAALRARAAPAGPADQRFRRDGRRLRFFCDLASTQDGTPFF